MYVHLYSGYLSSDESGSPVYGSVNDHDRTVTLSDEWAEVEFAPLIFARRMLPSALAPLANSMFLKVALPARDYSTVVRNILPAIGEEVHIDKLESSYYVDVTLPRLPFMKQIFFAMGGEADLSHQGVIGWFRASDVYQLESILVRIRMAVLVAQTIMRVENEFVDQVLNIIKEQPWNVTTDS